MIILLIPLFASINKEKPIKREISLEKNMICVDDITLTKITIEGPEHEVWAIEEYTKGNVLPLLRLNHLNCFDETSLKSVYKKIKNPDGSEAPLINFLFIDVANFKPNNDILLKYRLIGPVYYHTFTEYNRWIRYCLKQLTEYNLDAENLMKVKDFFKNKLTLSKEYETFETLSQTVKENTLKQEHFSFDPNLVIFLQINYCGISFGKILHEPQDYSYFLYPIKLDKRTGIFFVNNPKCDYMQGKRPDNFEIFYNDGFYNEETEELDIQKCKNSIMAQIIELDKKEDEKDKENLTSEIIQNSVGWTWIEKMIEQGIYYSFFKTMSKKFKREVSISQDYEILTPEEQKQLTFTNQ